jgi:signal transduction histidine kinase
VHSDAHWLVGNAGVRIPVSYRATAIRRGGRVTGAVLAFADIRERRWEEEAQRLRLRVSEALTASLDYRLALRSLARLALPLLGEFCLIDVAGADGSYERVACAHVDPARQRLFEQAFGQSQGARAGGPAALGAPPGADLDEAWRQTWVTEPAHAALFRGLASGPLSRVAMTVGVPGRPRLGTLTFGGRFAAPSEESRKALAQELARRAALTIENGRLYERANEAVRGRDQVLAVVSHDLGNPLSIIVGSADLLEAALPAAARSGRVTAALDRISRSATRMTRLIADLLDFASIQAGRFAIERAPVDPASLVGEAAAGFEETAKAKEVLLAICPADVLPRVSCDRDRVVQVLSNLLSNAIKVSPAHGHIEVRAESRGGEVVFAVSDTGPGIATEDLDHIFERFWRAREVGYRGTGLGLAIARGIVEAHGGRIWAESPPGAGATILFTLPAAAAPGQEWRIPSA